MVTPLPYLRCRRGCPRHVLAWLPLVAVICLLGDASAGSHSARADELFSQSLSQFKFEGVALQNTVETFLRLFPKAQLQTDRFPKNSGIVSYAVKDLKSADGATFYFVDGTLYQIEIRYKATRLDSMGGFMGYLAQLIKTLGPVDRNTDGRWSWLQATQSRRADLFKTEEGVLFTVTDTEQSLRVEERLRRATEVKTMDIGF